MTHNTFTYRHSELPAIRPEIKAETVALDVHIADLILKSQGNYRELEELAEMLDSALDSCELNLKSIRIVPDSYQEKSAGGMLDLPFEQKELIYTQLAAFAAVMESFMNVAGLTRDEANLAIFQAIEQNIPSPTEEEVNDTLRNLIESQIEERATGSLTDKMKILAAHKL
ncbi:MULTISPECIES: hypothetical protein [unclassified Microcoleus]|uniref:hypothetical protein n=1 Tax=unclassified Microcoleus TaxID=2642155 RepID=UPI002FD78D21